MTEVHDLTKYYGPKMAISGVSFRVEQGEILGLLDPNAAGICLVDQRIAQTLSPRPDDLEKEPAPEEQCT